MEDLVKNYAKYAPVIAPVVLIVVQSLIDSGDLNVSTHTLALINAVLAAIGLHALHIRTK